MLGLGSFGNFQISFPFFVFFRTEFIFEPARISLVHRLTQALFAFSIITTYKNSADQIPPSVISSQFDYVQIVLLS